MPNEKFTPLITSNKCRSPKLVWYNSRIKLKFKGSCIKQEDKTVFTPKNVVNIFIVYDFDTWPRDINTDFTFKNCFFGSVKLTKNAEPNNYKYSSQGIGCDSRSFYLWPDNTTRRSVIIFGADMNSYVHIDNKEKDILILGDGPTQGLDDNILTQKLFILLMHNQIQNFV